MIGMESID